MKDTKSFPYRLLAPGPVPIPIKVRTALAEPALHHRTPEFEKLLTRCFDGLKQIFATEQPVLIQAATGSGAMESALVNTLNAGDEVLALVGGKFGERWAEMAKRFGMHVHVLELPWGKKPDLQQFESAVKKHGPNLKAVLTQACETSTATLFPVQEIARITRAHSEALVMVDAITAMGCLKLPMDEWGLDVVVAGSQKAFMLPTGMSFIGISAKAFHRHGTTSTPRFYFDWAPELKLYPRSTYFSTPNSMVVALARVLDILEHAGADTVHQRCLSLAEATRTGAESLGLNLFSEAPSPSVTAIRLPDGVNGEKVRDALEKEKNITVMGGQDQLKGKILRVGHMGAITDDDMIALFHSLADVLNIKPGADLDQRLRNALSSSREYFQ